MCDVFAYQCTVYCGFLFDQEQKKLNYVAYAPINVKPEGGGDRATHGNLTVMHIPRVGIFT